MGMNCVDAEMLKKAFLAGAKGLEANKEWINELNVFPVPDGDTGTNMTMTIGSQRGGRARETDDGISRKGDFIRFFEGRQGKLRRHSVPIIPRIYERAQGRGRHHDDHPGQCVQPRYGDGLQGRHEAEGGHDPDCSQGDGG